MYRYKRIKLKGKLTRDEHRLVMESIIGRRLMYNEVIHHINGKPKDNRPENLQIMTRQEHGKLHGKQVVFTDKMKEILLKANLGVPKPWQARYTKEQIREAIELRNQGMSLRAIEKQTGICRKTISNVCKNKVLCYL